MKTLQDWKSYADQASLISVVKETPLPTTPGTDPTLIFRSLTIKIEQTLWSRHDPVNFSTLRDFGWILQYNGSRIPATEPGHTRLEVGHRYVIAVGAFSHPGGTTQDLVTPDSALEVKGDTVVAPSGTHPTSVSEFARQLNAAQPSPAAAKYGNLPPAARARKVAQEQGHT